MIIVETNWSSDQLLKIVSLLTTASYVCENQQVLSTMKLFLSLGSRIKVSYYEEEESSMEEREVTLHDLAFEGIYVPTDDFNLPDDMIVHVGSEDDFNFPHEEFANEDIGESLLHLYSVPVVE